jgi:hypothetical protein
MATRWVRACKVEELSRAGALGLELERVRVALFWRDGRAWALIDRKVAALIVIGGQDNVQAVAGQMLTFFSELGFQFPPFPFIAHSRGWDAEDMEQNVRAVQASESLRAGARELAARAIQTWKDITQATRLEPGGRKAQADAAQRLADA